MEPIKADLLIAVIQLTLMVGLNGGWKVYALAGLGALLFGILDTLSIGVGWQAAIFYQNNIKSMLNSLTPVKFTLKLTCPSCKTDFQARVLLPVTFEDPGETTQFEVTQAISVEI